MAAFNGIHVYEILENGNILTGVYTNRGSLKIDSEIAEKKQHDFEGVKGVYCCRYIESGNDLVTKCELKISNNNGIYEFNWSKGNGPNWIGLGLMVGTSHIAVSYEESKISA